MFLKNAIQILLSLASLAFIARPAIAYKDDDSTLSDGTGIFIEQQMLVPTDQLTTSCPLPVESRRACLYNYPVIKQKCEIVETRELGVFGLSQYLVQRFLLSVIYEEGEGKTYQCETDEVALIELPMQSKQHGKARIVWYDAVERDYGFISSVKMYSTAEGKSILAPHYCTNGTGGCVQKSLIWTGANWQKLERDESWQDVYNNLPNGYRQHKSPEINFDNLIWEQNLIGPDDPNCCPSGKIEFELSLIDNKLSVKSYKISLPAIDEAEEIYGKLIKKNVSDFDQVLPDIPLEEWLQSILPKDVSLKYHINDCGEQTGNPDIDNNKVMPVCFGIEADVISRYRKVELLFVKDNLQYHSGTVFSDELEGTVIIERLSKLDSALKKPLRPFPIHCPDATVLKLKEEYAGLEEWCEDSKGRKQGPYRSWFSTGIYLMRNGHYKDNKKTGNWLECSRFEKCKFRNY